MDSGMMKLFKFWFGLGNKRDIHLQWENMPPHKLTVVIQ
jgi:hypothetical protein